MLVEVRKIQCVGKSHETMKNSSIGGKNVCTWPEDSTLWKENTLKQKTQSFPYHIFVQFISTSESWKLLTSFIYLYFCETMNEPHAIGDLPILVIYRSVIKDSSFTIMWTSEVETILSTIQCTVRDRHILNAEFHICSKSLIHVTDMILVLVSLFLIVFLKIHISRHVEPSAGIFTVEEFCLFNEIFGKPVLVSFVTWKYNL